LTTSGKTGARGARPLSHDDSSHVLALDTAEAAELNEALGVFIAVLRIQLRRGGTGSRQSGYRVAEVDADLAARLLMHARNLCDCAGAGQREGPEV
jgi:hypothetical protein